MATDPALKLVALLERKLGDTSEAERLEKIGALRGMLIDLKAFAADDVELQNPDWTAPKEATISLEKLRPLSERLRERFSDEVRDFFATGAGEIRFAGTMFTSYVEAVTVIAAIVVEHTREIVSPYEIWQISRADLLGLDLFECLSGICRERAQCDKAACRELSELAEQTALALCELQASTEKDELHGWLPVVDEYPERPVMSDAYMELVAAAKDMLANSDSEADTPQPEFGGNRHSSDFRSVHWNDAAFSFTANQAATVKRLWEAWESGTPEVGDQSLLELADLAQKRIDHLFRKHPAWGTMIISGTTKGSRRIAGECPKRIQAVGKMHT